MPMMMLVMMWLLQREESSNMSMQSASQQLSQSADNLSTSHQTNTASNLTLSSPLSSTALHSRSSLSHSPADVRRPKPSSASTRRTSDRSECVKTRSSSPTVESERLENIAGALKHWTGVGDVTMSDSEDRLESTTTTTTTTTTRPTTTTTTTNATVVKSGWRSNSADRWLGRREFDRTEVRDVDSDDSYTQASPVTGVVRLPPRQRQQQRRQSDRLHRRPLDPADVESDGSEDSSVDESPVTGAARSLPRRSGSHVITRTKAFYNIERPLSIVRRGSASNDCI